MNVEQLFNFQKILDERVLVDQNLDENTLLPQKILALQSELGKLADKTNCFKFWGNQPNFCKNIVLENFIQCLGFILSIGLEKGFSQNLNLNVLEDTDHTITSQFLTLYIDINDFIICSSRDTYITLVEDFLILGKTLNLSIKEMEDTYLRRNSIHCTMQAEGY